MKQAIEEIQSTRRPRHDPTHLLAFALGGVLVALLLPVVRGTEAVEVPLRSGPLAHVMKQVGPNSQISNSFNEGEGVGGHLYQGYLLIEYPNAVEVVPVDRLYEARFHR